MKRVQITPSEEVLSIFEYFQKKGVSASAVANQGVELYFERYQRTKLAQRPPVEFNEYAEQKPMMSGNFCPIHKINFPMSKSRCWQCSAEQIVDDVPLVEMVALEPDLTMEPTND